MHKAFAIVRDVSTTGAFIECEALLSLNSNVELQILLGALQPNSSTLGLNFEGKIIRAEERDGRTGFAIVANLSVSKV